MKPGVSLVRCDSYQEKQVELALDRLLDLTDGLSWVRPGHRIVIKPNLLMPKHPDSAGTTHPVLVQALARRLLSHGATVVIGDSPGGPFTQKWLKLVYDATQMSSLVQPGVVLNENTQASQLSFAKGKVLKKLEVADFILQADAVISVAKLKTHAFMTFTGAVKNLFGIVPGTIKAEYHQRMPDPDLFADMLVDLAEWVRPRLSLIDGIIGMEGNGPSGGQPRKAGVLLASANPHACDLVAADLIGLCPDDVPTLKAAVARGLCPVQTDQVLLQGDDIAALRVPDFKKAEAVSPLRSVLEYIGRSLLNVTFKSVPFVDAGACIGCGECVQACPPQVIQLKNDKPVIDRKTCICCFCCQELCPRAAISVKRTRLARLLQDVKR